MHVAASPLVRLGLIAALTLVVTALAHPQAAQAHAVLERSKPAQNEQLAEAPERVETWFSEPLERSLTKLEVLDTQGRPVHRGKTLFSDDPLYAAVALPPDLAPGVYTATYQNVSTVDGHSWSGFFTFIILRPDGTVPQGAAFQPEALEAGGQGYIPEVGDGYFRWTALTAAVALGGATTFYLLIAAPAARFLRTQERRRVEGGAMGAVAGTAVIAWVVLASSEVGSLALLADRLGGPERVDDILLHTRTGAFWLARQGAALAALLAFLPALTRERWTWGGRARAATLTAMACTLGLLMTYSLTSHAEAGGGAFWGVASDFVHFVATAAWLGALAQMALLFWWTQRRLEGPERLLYRANALDRFSWLAVIGVFLLIGTGVFNGFVQLPRLPALWDTTYGRVLIAKLTLIVPLLGIAGINAFFLKPALVDGIAALQRRGTGEEPTSDAARLERRIAALQRWLPRTTVAEFLAGMAVLASVSVLAQTTTAGGELRAEANEPTGRFTASAEADDLNVSLRIEPFGIGLSTFSVRLAPRPGTDASLDNVIGVRLNAVFDDPNRPASAGTTGTDLELKQKKDNPAVWAAEAALLTQPGDWRIRALIRRSGEGVFDAQTDYIAVSEVGGFLARRAVPKGTFDLPFTFVDWNVVGGGALVTLGLAAVIVWRRRPPSWSRAVSTPLAFSGLLGLMAGVVLLFGVHTHEGSIERTLPPEIASNPRSVFIGRDIFLRNCAVCHGEQGAGDGPKAARLRTPPADLTLHVGQHNDGTLFFWVSEGFPLDSEDKIMPAFKTTLSEEERWHVVNYLREVFGSGRYEPLEENVGSRN